MNRMLKFGAGLGAGFLAYYLMSEANKKAVAEITVRLLEKTFSTVQRLVEEKGDRAVEAMRAGMREARRKEAELNEIFKQNTGEITGQIGKETAQE